MRLLAAGSQAVSWLVIVAMAAAFALSVSPARATGLVINSGRKEPFTTPDGRGFYDILVKALFERVGMDSHVHTPAVRTRADQCQRGH